jgi:two-component system, NarL family, response regulator LiaR
VTTVRIALVDDHRVVTRSLKAYLESFEGLQVVGMASSGEELLDRLAEWQPDVILQDILMPGGIDGIQTTRRILERAPDVRVIALTASIDEARMIGVLRAGAAGYVRKDAEPETLLAAVRAVARGKTFLDPAVGPMLAATHRANNLSKREEEVLRELVLGKSNKEIGAALAIGEQTVKTHVANVLAKLDVENRGQATIEALKRGVVTLDDLQ